MMTLKDLEKVQKTFQEAGQDYQVELEDGRFSIVGPSDREKKRKILQGF